LFHGTSSTKTLSDPNERGRRWLRHYRAVKAIRRASLPILQSFGTRSAPFLLNGE
jgi:hypothetical protein